jgi:hypothetical protein
MLLDMQQRNLDTHHERIHLDTHSMAELQSLELSLMSACAVL